MKALLLLFGLTIGTCAVIRTVDLMNQATAAFDQSLQLAQR